MKEAINDYAKDITDLMLHMGIKDFTKLIDLINQANTFMGGK